MTSSFHPPPIIPSSPTPAAPRVIDVFLRYLKAEGVSVVFGIPGGLLYPFFAVIEADPDIDLIVSKHEEGAAFMADGHARVSRRLSVCAGTSGPGATNLLTGVACAFADGVPMLVVTGQAATHALGKGAAQETSREDMDIVAMFRPVTKYSAMVNTPQSVAQHLRRALRHALTGRPGPVHLNIPVDLWERPLHEEWFDPKSYRPETRTFDRVAVQRAATMLMAAKRPILFVGAGVGIAGAEEHLRAVAELLSARVVTTPRGKGLFPENHPLSLGVLGFAGHAEARNTVLGKEVDLVLTVGTSLNETATLNWAPALRAGKQFLQLDIDSEKIGRNYPVDLALVGDAQTVLVELAYHLHRLLRDGQRPASEWNAKETVPRTYESAELLTSDQTPLTQQRWRAELQKVLPADAIVFSDIGGHMLSNIHYLTITERQKFVLNLGFGSMGHGTVAPIGAALALPGRPIIAIIGDACFTMNGMELVTAAEYGLNSIIWIVENNNMHGITYHASRALASGALSSVRYKRPLQVAAMARAMGLTAWVVEEPGQFEVAFREALEASSPALIEVRVDPNQSPPLGDRVRSISGFVDK